tara:strand:+ start:98 stop:433 length:336 start_codon:yes stop_codon:yes gene_type:complete
MNLPDNEHFKSLFKLIVQSCEDEKLAIMRVKHRSTGVIHMAIVSVSLEKVEDDSFSVEVTPLALLLSPEMAKSIDPLIDFDHRDEWDIQFDDTPIELDDRNHWRPPTKGLL